MSMGDKIKSARKKAGLTQKELGERLGISYQTVAQWENNLRNPKINTVQKLAEALEIPPSELIGLDPSYEGTSLPQSAHLGNTPKELEIAAAFRKLNAAGQDKAIERVSELSEIPKYQK